jgi:hypothetical protein
MSRARTRGASAVRLRRAERGGCGAGRAAARCTPEGNTRTTGRVFGRAHQKGLAA